jgi:hypothetical protein
LSTFLGWTIVPMPATPVARTIDWTANDMVSVNTSPFTGQQQVQNWGNSLMEASVTMPVMADADARKWIAWLMACQGIAGVFAFGDPLATAPLGSGGGTPIVSGSGQTGYALNTSGWPGAGAILPGDWIQIGLRLYRNVGNQSGTSSTLTLWPQIRESPADGAAIITVNTQGMFRLKGNARKWSVSQVKTYGFQFDLREAI